MIHTLDMVVPVADVLPSEYCQELINKFEKKADSQIVRDNEYQKFSELNLNQHSEFDEDVHKLIGISRNLLAFYKDEIGVKFFPENFRLEEFRLKKYTAGTDDSFEWHVDVGNYQSAERFMVCMYYLNDVQEGGETMFDWDCNDNIASMVKPEEGHAIMFPSLWTHPHKANKPISNDKYILSTYGRYI